MQINCYDLCYLSSVIVNNNIDMILCKKLWKYLILWLFVVAKPKQQIIKLICYDLEINALNFNKYLRQIQL
jgi:hypothetical protein